MPMPPTKSMAKTVANNRGQNRGHDHDHDHDLEVTQHFHTMVCQPTVCVWVPCSTKYPSDLEVEVHRAHALVDLASLRYVSAMAFALFVWLRFLEAFAQWG